MPLQWSQLESGPGRSSAYAVTGQGRARRPAADAQRYLGKTMNHRVIWCALILGGLTLSGGCSERFESTYADKAAAIQDGAIHRGWIPGWIPESATALREMHDLDTNEVWLAFDLPHGDESVPGECSLLTDAVSGLPNRNPKWWPDELSSSDDESRQYRVYRCETDRQRGYLAVKPGAARLYYWRGAR